MPGWRAQPTGGDRKGFVERNYGYADIGHDFVRVHIAGTAFLAPSDGFGGKVRRPAARPHANP